MLFRSVELIVVVHALAAVVHPSKHHKQREKCINRSKYAANN